MRGTIVVLNDKQPVQSADLHLIQFAKNLIAYSLPVFMSDPVEADERKETAIGFVVECAVE